MHVTNRPAITCGEVERWVAAVALALMGGCATSALTFETPGFQLTTSEWKFRGRAGSCLATDHFQIYTTVSDVELREYLPGFLETAYQLYASLLPAPDGSPRAGTRLQTYVLDNRNEWERFVKERFGERYPIYRKISSGGFTEGRTSVVYNIGRAATLSVIAHEGWHQYVGSQAAVPIPAWLNEGLATYCESVEFRKDKPYFVPQRNTFRLDNLRNALVTGTAMPLRQLLSTNAGEVIDGRPVAATAAYYAQAWALTVYLRHGAHGRYADRFGTMAADLRNGSMRIKAQAARVASPHPSQTSYGEAVFFAYITEDLDAFENELNAYLKRLCWN